MLNSIQCTYIKQPQLGVGSLFGSSRTDTTWFIFSLKFVESNDSVYKEKFNKSNWISGIKLNKK